MAQRVGLMACSFLFSVDKIFTKEYRQPFGELHDQRSVFSCQSCLENQPSPHLTTNKAVPPFTGHYICDGVFRNASQGDGNACWITYDDDVVKETTFNHVCQQRQKTAYLLYYERMQKDENQDQEYG